MWDSNFLHTESSFLALPSGYGFSAEDIIIKGSGLATMCETLVCSAIMDPLEIDLEASSNSSLTENRWLLDSRLSGPAISAIVAVEFILSLFANLFILMHTIYNVKKICTKSSTFLLLNLALSDLLVTILYMPFMIVSTAAGEWIIGQTDRVREAFCNLSGFFLLFSLSLSLFILAFISFDRFLYIVKPYHHHRWMTWKTTVGLVAAGWVSEILGLDINLGRIGCMRLSNNACCRGNNARMCVKTWAIFWVVHGN
jgi:hypothetical protein